MKQKAAFGAIVALVAAFILFSCEKEQSVRKTSSKATTATASEKTWYIYHATWVTWGRKKKDCDGWGLCYYSDCWFCEVPSSAHSGTVVANDQTGEGNLYIELNPDNQQEADAIESHATFYVDEDIQNENSILRAGAYAFNPEVGPSGGYVLNITVTHF